MALLPLHSPLLPSKNPTFLHFPLISISPAKPKPRPGPGFVPATSQDSSKSAINDDPPPPAAEPPSNESQPKKPISSGQGFGPPSLPKPNPDPAKKQKGGRRERSSVVRRSPVERPAFLDKKDGEMSTDQAQNESAFLLAWLALGAVILVEGIALAASGFLPEQWDNFFVKYLYPSFTPTVGLFVAGTVAYGVFKYFQNENAKTPK